MSSLQRRSLLLALAASLAALWLHLSMRQAADSESRRSDLPDLTVEQPVWQLFDQDGALHHEVRAVRLEQWPGESEARLIEPRLHLVDHRQQRWLASARRGWIPEDQQHLVLEQQVRLRQEPQAGGLRISTEQLRIDRQDDLIETDRPVVLASGNWHFTASGLRAELGRQQLQLQGNVRGTHE